MQCYFKIPILLESYKHFLPICEQPDKRVWLLSTLRSEFTSSFIKFDCGFHTSISRPYSGHENDKYKPAYEIRRSKVGRACHFIEFCDSLWVRCCNWSRVIYGCHRIMEALQTDFYLFSKCVIMIKVIFRNGRFWEVFSVGRMRWVMLAVRHPCTILCILSMYNFASAPFPEISMSMKHNRWGMGFLPDICMNTCRRTDGGSADR